MIKHELINWNRGSHGLGLLTVLVVSLFFSSCDLRDHKVSSARQMVSDYENEMSSNSMQTDSRESRLRALVNKISPDDFRSYLKAYAESLASEWYGGGGPSGYGTLRAADCRLHSFSGGGCSMIADTLKVLCDLSIWKALWDWGCVQEASIYGSKVPWASLISTVKMAGSSFQREDTLS